MIKELQDTLTVTVEINGRPRNIYLRSAKYQERVDQNPAEITDKLNGLIGYVDN